MKVSHPLTGLALLTAAAFAVTLTVQNISEAAPADKRQNDKKRVLVVTVTKGFRHDSIPLAEKTIEMLGEKTGSWTTDFARTDDELKTKMTAEALKGVDTIVFANTTGVLPLPDPQAFLDFIKSGKGFVAMHSGSDTFHEWPGSSASVSEYVQMLGGEFLTHHQQCAIDGQLLDPKHPALKAVAKAAKQADPARANAIDLKQNTAPTPAPNAPNGVLWKAFDEIYILKNVDRANLHVLISLDKYPNDGSKEANTPGENLIAWTRAYGKGRVFYTSLGHRQEMWRDPIYQEHITGGIRYALGLEKGSAKPNPPTK